MQVGPSEWMVKSFVSGSAYRCCLCHRIVLILVKGHSFIVFTTAEPRSKLLGFFSEFSTECGLFALAICCSLI